MTPSTTAFDVDKPKLGLLSKRQNGTGVPPAACGPPFRGPTGADGEGACFSFYLFLFIHTALLYCGSTMLLAYSTSLSSQRVLESRVDGLSIGGSMHACTFVPLPH